MSATRLAIVFAFVAGLAGAAQAAIAGALGRRVGSVQAAAFGTVIAAAILVLLAVILGRGGGIVDALHQPVWLWSIGVLGATIVLAITFAPPRIGTFATVALLIARSSSRACSSTRTGCSDPAPASDAVSSRRPDPGGCGRCVDAQTLNGICRARRRGGYRRAVQPIT